MTKLPKAPPALPPLSWPVQMQDNGSMSLRLDNYTVDYFPRSSDTLVVTFDPRMKTYPPSESRDPWAMAFLAKYGVSALQVKPDASCWYRLPDIEQAFAELSASGFFENFETVITYGGSMGGFGALSFAGLCKAKRVLSINPQVNLGPSVRSWETRYGFANTLNWDGPLCDIAA